MPDLGNVITMFTNQTANGNSEEAVLTRVDSGHSILLSGNLDGATVTMELQGTNGFVPIGGGVLTAIGSVFLEGTAAGKTIRGVLSGVGASTDITLEVTK